jgi:hypothetical protein
MSLLHSFLAKTLMLRNTIKPSINMSHFAAAFTGPHPHFFFPLPSTLTSMAVHGLCCSDGLGGLKMLPLLDVAAACEVRSGDTRLKGHVVCIHGSTSFMGRDRTLCCQ